MLRSSVGSITHGGGLIGILLNSDHALGSYHNDNEERLLQICTENHLHSESTNFQHECSVRNMTFSLSKVRNQSNTLPMAGGISLYEVEKRMTHAEYTKHFRCSVAAIWAVLTAIRRENDSNIYHSHDFFPFVVQCTVYMRHPIILPLSFPGEGWVHPVIIHIFLRSIYLM